MICVLCYHRNKVFKLFFLEIQVYITIFKISLHRNKLQILMSTINILPTLNSVRICSIFSDGAYCTWRCQLEKSPPKFESIILVICKRYSCVLYTSTDREPPPKILPGKVNSFSLRRWRTSI